MMHKAICFAFLFGGVATWSAHPALALDEAHRAKAQAMAARGAARLIAAQGPDGSWSPESGPAVTGLVVAGLLKSGAAQATDPAVVKGLNYILSKQKEDGGIYETLLPNYNTSVCLMALGQVRDQDPRYAKAVERAQKFASGLQWRDDQEDAQGKKITQDHPWFGGVGYGTHGRPDGSNLAMFVVGLKDSGFDCKSPEFQRMLVFAGRLQGSKSNVLFGDQIVPDGGFIYATSVNKDQIGVPQSMAGSVTDSQGRSRLLTYGSMTYAGFMSYIYAELPADDPRVLDAYNWIRRNYTLNQNPGMVDDTRTEKDERLQGYFYYLHVFSRALSAWSTKPDRPEGTTSTTLATADGKIHDWANDLTDRLAQLQSPDGSWINNHDRWMEGDPNLVTAYALMCLGHALRE